MAEAVSLAKELKDTHGLAVALFLAGSLAQYERNPSEVERCTLELAELSTRQNFALWLIGAELLRGWAQCASGRTVEGFERVELAIRDLSTSGTTLNALYALALKAEALHLSDRTPEALTSIKEAEALAERLDERWWSAELHRLRGVFLATLGAEVAQIGASFQAAIKIAKEQKSVSLEKRAEATYADYHRQKASAAEGCEFRLPL